MKIAYFHRWELTRQWICIFNQQIFKDLHIYKRMHKITLHIYVMLCLCSNTFNVPPVPFNAQFTTSSHALHCSSDECMITSQHSDFSMNASSQFINIVGRGGINFAFQIAPQEEVTRCKVGRTRWPLHCLMQGNNSITEQFS